ncbi:phage holin superfamily [Candidatus Gastranaerophilus sp. (ex Termes propinquus)]|nr:phage holin superfamily [Candidatus Gastranaerophilus sp. (ex Termes propinquus)]
MKTVIKWTLYALIIMFTAWIIPGIHVEGFLGALLVAFVLALINTFLKPVLKLITLPINVVTLGLFSLVLNALLLMFAGFVTPGFVVDGFWHALFGSIIIAVLSAGVERIE